MRGAVLKTLFVYCSADDTLNALCKESASKKDDTLGVKLGGVVKHSAFGRRFAVNKTPEFDIPNMCDADFENFDRVIFACDGYFGEIPPEVCAFITNCELRYKEIYCILFAAGRNIRRAEDSLRMAISLSGGTVKNIVSISAKQLKRDEEDVFFSVRHRLAV